MKAAVLEEIGRMEVKEVPTPKGDSQGVLIRVKSCAICGTDVRIFLYGHSKVRFPFIIGHEIAGEVVDVGKKAKEKFEDLKEGDRVIVAPGISCGKCDFCLQGVQNMCPFKKMIGYDLPGGFAEYFFLPLFGIKNIIKIPNGVTFDEACTTEPLACCINGQRSLCISPSDTVAIIGAGPIGFIHFQLAKLKGAAKVILIDKSKQRLELIKKIDPEAVFLNSLEQDPVGGVLQETRGEGAKKIIVACSSGEAQEQALEMTSKRGKIVFFGGLPKENPFIKFNSNLLHYKEVTVYGSMGSTIRHHKLGIQLIASGKIPVHKMITSSVSLFQIVKGICRVKEGKELKVIVNP